MIALVSANCSSCLRPHNPIDGTTIIPSASKSALQRYHPGSIAVSVSVSRPTIVTIRIIPKLWKRREERETKRVDKDKRLIVETVEMTKTIIPIKVAVIETVEAAGGV